MEIWSQFFCLTANYISGLLFGRYSDLHGKGMKFQSLLVIIMFLEIMGLVAGGLL